MTSLAPPRANPGVVAVERIGIQLRDGFRGTQRLAGGIFIHHSTSRIQLDAFASAAYLPRVFASNQSRC